MATYKNIRIKKKGGGTRLQRVQVLKSGKYKFVKNTGTAKTSKKSTKKKSTTKSTKKRGSNMAKKKGKKKNGFSVTGLMRGGLYAVTALQFPASVVMVHGVKRNNWEEVPQRMARGMAGIDDNGEFSLNVVKKAYAPLIGWSVMDFAFSKLGVWKKIGQLLKF